MSDFSALSVGLSGLEAQQVAEDTVGQNVANANTAGYDEESVELGALPSTQTIGFYTHGNGPGDGVAVEGIERLTDSYLQTQSYTEQGNQGVLSAQQSGLQAVQQNFPEPSSNGISSQLTQYWQDWSTLANDPSDSSAQATVVQDGSTLATSLNETSSALSTLSQQTVQNITGTLAQVNQEASQIASLNQSISQGTASTTSVDELEDQRDQLVSQLSSQLGVTVVNNPDGTVNVNSGSESIVSGNTSQKLSLTSSGPPYSLVWSNDKSTYQPSGGEVAGMLDVVNNYVPSYQQNLDQVAQSLMGSVNHLMSTGYDQAGNQGAPFFLGTGASDIEVNPTLVANPADLGANASPLPAGSSATNEDGTVAAEVGELPNSQTVTMSVPAGGWSQGASVSAWTGATTTTGVEADVAYNQLVTGIGQATASVNNQLTDQQTITTNVNSALQSSTGVNTDQELTNMVMYQNAYEASAKFISTVDATLQSLISMVNG
jgi:flagellar hook-associated protein 1 FlgK